MKLNNLRIGKRLWIMFLTLVTMTILIGAVGIYYNGASTSLAVKISDEGHVYDQVIMDYKYKAANLHLWFEEIIAGDRNENIEDVWKELEKASELIEILENGGNYNGKIIQSIRKIPEAYKLVKLLKYEMASFTSVARKRYSALSGATGVGSDVDQEFDQRYQLVQMELKDFESVFTEEGMHSLALKCAEGRYLFADAHLFLEEFLTGDTKVIIGNVRKQFHEGGTIVSSIVQKLGKTKTLTIKQNTDLLLLALDARLDTEEKGFGIGSEHDQLFDEKYEVMIAKAEQLEELIQMQSKEIMNELAENSQHSKEIYIFIIIATITAGFFIGLSLIRSILFPILPLVVSARRLSRGDLPSPLTIHGNDELAELSQIFNELIQSTTEITTQAGAIINGDYSTIIDLRSDNDQLILAMNQMTTGLEDKLLQTKQTDWVKGGLNILSEKLISSNKFSDICQDVISFLAKYLDAKVGTFYVLNDNVLELQATYAFVNRKSIKQKIVSGEGIAGETLREKTVIVISDIPDDYIMIDSSLGDTVPKSLVAVPLSTKDEDFGVIELGSLSAFTELQIEFLTTCAVNISAMIMASRQAKNLQKQQEELKASNEELAEQTQRLQTSEEELQSQQEELRATNEELAEKNRHLQKQQSEIKKQNSDLQMAKESINQKAIELEQSTKYKSEFLANVSHEVRTPLNSLLVLARNLMKNSGKNLTEKQIGDLGIIHNSGSELLNLINEILDISKIESGKMDISYENLLLSSFVQELDDMFKHVADEKGITFKTKISESAPQRIVSDKVKITHVLRNLISNAIKFTAKGTVELSIDRLKNDDDVANPLLTPDNSIVFSVSDTGVGIDDDQIDKIFDAFHQADGSTSRSYGGTGLGLSITKSLVEILGGEVRVTSRVNGGSCFIITLPLEQNITVSNELVEVITPVLIIEKDKMMAKEIVDLLNNDAIGSKTVESLSAAVEFLQNNSVLCAVVDVEMGDDDIEMLQKIKKASSNNLQLIVYTKKTFSDIEIGHLEQIPSKVIAKGKHSLKRVRDEVVASLTVDENVIKEIVAVDDPQLNGKRILVVDDDVRNLYAISDLLEPYGITIIKSGNAKHALETLEDERDIELVITDIMMSEMDGYELIKTIRSKKKFEKLPIIALTAKTMEQDKRECYAAGANDYLTKPIDDRKMIDTLRVWLAKEEV